MNFYDKSSEYALNIVGSDKDFGLSSVKLNAYREKYGYNRLTKRKKRGFFSRLLCALKEPMLIILIFGFVLAFGTNLGKFLKSGDGDFGECFGILLAVLLSVFITLFMEGSSEKAFAALNRIYDNIAVKVIRNGKTITISQSDVCVGDIVFIESGDKIVADGRLIESNALAVDESALTGESISTSKDANVVLNASVPLAERKNTVYSGTFVTSGSGIMLVTAIGDSTEIGKIAGELGGKDIASAPLQQKLSKLGKTISAVGAVSAILVFVLSVARLAIANQLTFSGVQELFVSCIILIVAAVPEGLPTIVAVSLALNMIKLASENALIKKMTATETAGAVSVICSDKTGTLTENKMSVVSICMNEFCIAPEDLTAEHLFQNFICNSTAEVIVKNKRTEFYGSGTECALISAFIKSNKNIPYTEYRKRYPVHDRQPFSSDEKLMTTTIKTEYGFRVLLKGAPEKVLKNCSLTNEQTQQLLGKMKEHQQKARRILCFAHADYKDGESVTKYTYDGFVALADPIRKEVYKAVADCRRAGIKVKILTGDNLVTAFAVAKELKIATEESQVITADELDKLDEKSLLKVLPKITVIARSTPIVKLKVVRALKKMGEVVAVTGDGVNDAPAIKHADVGISMGISGSEITKEAADIVLLDDSFATVVKAVSFGRNVYRNLQRFILFQLSVNLSALLFVTISAIMGLEPPFNTLQLLWINVIMDGPPALTLGLEKAGEKLMSLKPVKREDGIVSKKMYLRILFNGVFIGVIMILQYTCNFLCVKETERAGATFTLFILFQLFNAFNSRELGADSIFKSIAKNKIMVFTFMGVLIVHLFIVEVCHSLFGISPMSFSAWLKTIFTAFSIVIVSELFKWGFRMKKRAKREVLRESNGFSVN